MKPQDLEAKALAWLEAWNRHDLEAVIGHYSDYVVFTSPLLARFSGQSGRTLCGRSALRTAFAAVLARAPDLRLRLRHVLPGVNSVVLVYECGDGLLAAEVMEFDARGKVNRVTGHCTPRMARPAGVVGLTAAAR